MKLLVTKITLVVACLSILAFPSCRTALAFSSTAENKNPAYYFLSLIFDSEANSVALNQNNSAGKFSVDLTDINLTKDNGNGSQFFAKVTDAKSKPLAFKSGGDKFFLGQWKMVKFTEGYRLNGKRVGGGKENIKKGEVQVSVPFFPDGQKIEIYDAKTDKIALSVDVSKFSKVPYGVKSDTGALASSGGQNNPSQPAAANGAGNATSEAGAKQGFPWLWAIVGFFVLLLAGGSFFFYRRYKKYKSDIYPN